MKLKFTDWSFLQQTTTAIESYLKKTHEQFMQSTVVFEAKNYASKNLPTKDEDSFEPYLTTIRGFYGKLKKEVSIKLQGGVQKIIGAANVATSNGNIKAKEAEADQESAMYKRQIVDRGRISVDGSQASYKKQQSLLTFFAIGECLWTASAFLKLGDVLLIAVCVGIVIGVAQVVGVKSAVQNIKEVEEQRKRKFWWIVATFCALALSFCLALLRYWFIHKSAGIAVPFLVMNPLTFVAINMLFISVTALIVLFNYPTKAQINDIEKAKKMDGEIQKSKDRLKVLNDELIDLRKEREFLYELGTRLEHAETKLHEKVGTMFDEAVGAFKHENTVKRSDQEFPQSFKNPYLPLSDESDGHVPVIEDPVTA